MANDRIGDGLYWKLEDRNLLKPELGKLLGKAGYTNASALNKAQLQKLLRRIDCELICYQICSMAELEKFVADRKIVITPGLSHKSRKRLLVDALMAADDQLEFHRFLDLPPELRNRVYELSMIHYPTKFRGPSHPPLPRTCKLLRQEVLPIFYARSIFELEFIRFDVYGENEFEPWTEDDSTELFFGLTPPAYVGCIRQFIIEVTVFEALMDHDVLPAGWRLVLDPATRSWEMGLQAGGRSDGLYFRSDFGHAFEKETRETMNDILQAVMSRPGKVRLRMADLRDLI
jgi:hypothetical protein